MTKARFTKAELSRAIAAMKDANVPVGAVEVKPDGSFVIMSQVDKSPVAVESEGPEPW